MKILKPPTQPPHFYSTLPPLTTRETHLSHSCGVVSVRVTALCLRVPDLSFFNLSYRESRTRLVLGECTDQQTHLVTKGVCLCVLFTVYSLI